jgi:uncharacterized protein (DUF433 family)
MAEQNWRARIVCDPDLLHGEPCVRGTRIPVSILVASLTDLRIEDLLREYPQLERADIDAAILFAAESAQGTMVA